MARPLAACVILLLLLIAAPVAAACDWAQEPPGPGAFVIWDPHTDAKWRVDVSKRMSGADCSLTNPQDFDGRVLTWVEDGKVHQQSPGSAARKTLPITFSNYLSAMSVGPKELYTFRFTGTSGARELHAHDMATGSERLVLRIGTGQPSPFLWGHMALVGTKDANGVTYGLLDMQSGEWVFQRRSAASFGVPAAFEVEPYAGGFAGRLIGFGHDEARWVHDLETGKSVNVTTIVKPKWSQIWLDGPFVYWGYSYSSPDRGRYHVSEARLDAMPSTPLDSAAAQRVQSEYVVFGIYSATQLKGTNTKAFEPRPRGDYQYPAGEAIPGPGAMLVLLVVGFAAAFGRPRRRHVSV
jgi:hypothetical protein